MPLSNAELEYFDHNVLRLTSKKRSEYHAQVDNLVSELKKRITDKSKLKVTKVVKAGSFAKYTILRKIDGYPTDVDVVFYVTGVDEDSKSYEELCNRIYDLLVDIYPTKKVEDFEIQRRAAKVTFVKSGLEVDIVPVLQHSTEPDHGWQFDIQSGERNLTCAPCHIKFIQARKDKDKHFRTLVRLAKRWKHFHDIPGLKSFHIELILAYLIDTEGPATSIEKRFRDFLVYIARTRLSERIDFPENEGKPQASFSDPVVIIDPVSPENNVASRISKDEQALIAKAAEEAWENANYASVENDYEVWKEIFGGRFKTKEE
ncbi:CBASS oligonucleotide cyclase [Vibrio parahaemolyticus]|uniref:CBASS oligonucleotide cyclase n=1 Tax=Vibrio parahaemolyticus TaxID=670 RepID=UPI000400FD7B|nr:CBASS oligonucleotide cyclase [Vibrio parahaemolyticus]KIT25094.1 nucleotidyltransferase [Vibrio parahaemolyticus VP766]EGR2769641.1 nucleotidyltransferase [Vibrio parahaemolyticus]EGR2834167.1 nucleotidyltransferase [Vibrio parahaemolyticus]EGR2888636.1 nucleotidyltransferase [Vibrio parahaemolyticus]EGR2907141.1 nucleotidyltransferase [Vibrio parahaemolyticus]